MKINTPLRLITAATLLLASNAVQAQTVVSNNLLTNDNASSAWQNCNGSNLVTETDTVSNFDPEHLEDEGCAYRETPVEAGTQYKMTCGVSSLKYSSLTLTFLNDNGTTLATETEEIFENVQGGAYSISLTAPAGATTAAVGIYGLAGSGFQDCTLLIDNPGPGPQDGSIAGVAWFDENEDAQRDANESLIPSTAVSLMQGNTVIATTTTELDGSYNFGGLDLGSCYQVQFEPADPTLTFAAASGDNDAVNTGVTNDVCPSEATPNVLDIDAGFVAIPPVEPPKDYAVCGHAWLENPDAGEGTALAYVEVTLQNIATANIHTELTGADGSYTFSNLPAGDYKLMFNALSGHTFVAGDSSLTENSSFAGTDGMTPQFNLPNSGNTGADDICTVRNANVGFNRTPVALEPTVAQDDQIEGLVGDALSVQILANDEPCNGEVQEVDLIGHNVPGNVTYNAATGAFDITATTDSGTYTIEYGLRGTCGSYDTANVTVTLAEPPPPPTPMAPAQPLNCQASIGKLTGFEDGVHLDLKYSAEQPEGSLASQYNFYDADMNLVDTGLLSEAGQRSWGVFWRKREHGLEVFDVVYITAVENGVESIRNVCTREKVTPIAIDTDNDGQVESLSGDFYFDITGNGIEEHLTQWFGPRDGILINEAFSEQLSGEHLFGDVDGEHSDGFAKLSVKDKNGDGQVSGDELNGLAIWTDRNSNTEVDAGEISTLASHSITKLSVEHYKYAARAELSNGKTLLMRDLWFAIYPIQQVSR